MGRLIKALANAGHPVKSGPTATGKFTGATIFQRPLQTPIDHVLRKQPGGRKKSDAPKTAPHTSVCLICLCERCEDRVPAFNSPEHEDPEKDRSLEEWCEENADEFKKLVVDCAHLGCDTSTAGKHCNRHLTLTDRSCALEKEYIEFKKGQGDKSPQETTIEKAFALGAPRVVGEEYSANDRAIIQLWMAEANTGCKTKLPLGFGKTRRFCESWRR